MSSQGSPSASLQIERRLLQSFHVLLLLLAGNLKAASVLTNRNSAEQSQNDNK